MQVTETSADGLKHEFTGSPSPPATIEDQVTEPARRDRPHRPPAGLPPGQGADASCCASAMARRCAARCWRARSKDSSAEAMREHNLRPALPPKVEIVSFAEGTDLEYKMAVEVLPEIRAEFCRSRHRAADARGAGRGDRQGARAHRRAAAQGGARRARRGERRHRRRRCRRPGRRAGNSRRRRQGPADRARLRQLHPGLRRAAHRRGRRRARARRA